MAMFGEKSAKATPVNDSFSANTIQNSTLLVGEVQSEGNIRIDGKLEGTLNTKAKLVVGPTGIITGDINCLNANIEGRIDGKMIVKEVTILKSTAKIQGDIETKKLVIEEGAVFNGRVSMGAKLSKSSTENDEPTKGFEKKAI